MASNNQHIHDFLSYYCQLNNPPEYAVLIKGPWGSGKTWFIQDCLKKLEEIKKIHLYVSLYGMTSIDDIENEFFNQLHPWLASKNVKLLGKLAKSLLNASIRLNLYDDEKANATFMVGIPSEKIIESLNISEEKVLVFDDVERCAIPICHLLGYINKFVEHNGFKVILVANEDEINKRESTDKSKLDEYTNVKEKIIGKTFEIVPEIESALSGFIDQLKDKKTKPAIEENKSLVIHLYNSSGYKNLRILRHALWDFDRLFEKLSDKITENKELVSHLLTFYLVFSFEIIRGNIFPNEISSLVSCLYLFEIKKNNNKDPDKKYLEILEKYLSINLRDPLLHTSIWQSIFGKGFIPIAEIEIAILNSKYFESENQTNWVRLWHTKDLSDQDFEKVLNKVTCKWKNMGYKKIGVVKHLAGLLLWLSEIGLYPKTKDEILQFAKKYIDNLKDQRNLLPSNDRQFSQFEDDNWGGLMFRSNDDEKFKKLKKYISAKEDEVLFESYPSAADDLLKLMKDNTIQFYRALIFNNHEDNRFYDMPILEYISPDDFVNAYLILTPDNRKTVELAFKVRYKHSDLNRRLTSEVDFLNKVIGLLEKEKETRSGKLSAYLIGTFIDQYLKNAVKILQKVQS